MLLTQGRLERFIIDAIRECSNLEIERNTAAESFEYDETLENGPYAYPITVKIRTINSDETVSNGKVTNGTEPEHMPNGLDKTNLSPDEWDDFASPNATRPSKTEVIRAKYLIGCDGAHSWTRKQVNIPMEGSNTDHIW